MKKQSAKTSETKPGCELKDCKNYAMWRGLCHQHWEQYKRLNAVVNRKD